MIFVEMKKELEVLIDSKVGKLLPKQVIINSLTHKGVNSAWRV